MVRTLAALMLGAALVGCSDVVATADMVRVGLVRIEDRVYSPAGPLEPESAQGPEYAEVLRYVDCSDGVWLGVGADASDWCPLENGDSNFLPAGTPLYRVEGMPPEEGLTVDTDNDRVLLRPVETEGS
jgi:hypothetical protein